MVWRRTATIGSLEEHPNLGEILGVLAQLPHVSDQELPRLAAAWHNTVYLADARARALSPDAPLVLEVLCAFEGMQSLFDDDLSGDADYVVVDPGVTSVALKAIRDAIAAAYARPILTRGEHAALMRAWRTVYPEQRFEEPDLGPNAPQVKGLLSALPFLSTRCHDGNAAELYSGLLHVSAAMDADLRHRAREETWRAAVLTARRRIWTLVRRSGAEALGRPCPSCGPRPAEDHDPRVLALCLDAACALLVTDAVDENLTDVLTLPLRRLIPEPRPATA
jgi:hypothetical protein